MTQEELDALMSGDMDLDDVEEEASAAKTDDDVHTEEAEASDHYKADATHSYPPPANSDNQVVHQLDDVTKESEEKASEIFDIIEGISNELMEEETSAQQCIETFEQNIQTFSALHDKFPDIATFKVQMEQNQEALECANKTVTVLQNSGDSIMQVMDIMQYQDIHRQKIERVINVMRALSNYMNQLFEGKVDDQSRVGSATHLPGDSTTENVVSSDDIEALIASLGKN
ncbi:MAG: chemotaxis protein [Sulfurimonas sp.]|nr:MAG: chemotaxis protein [Sulfurimonas sp.]